MIFFWDAGERFTYESSYCSIYFCHSAGTTSTAIRLLREGANSIAIGM